MLKDAIGNGVYRSSLVLLDIGRQRVFIEHKSVGLYDFRGKSLLSIVVSEKKQESTYTDQVIVIAVSEKRNKRSSE